MPSRFWRITRRTFIGLVLVVLVVFVVAALGLFPEEPLRRVVESSLRRTFGPNTSVARVHVFPAGLRGEVEGLVVDTPAYRLEIPRLAAAIRPGTLFGGAVRLRYLRVQQPELRIKTPNPNAPKTAAADLPALVLADVQVDDGRLVVEMGARGTIESRGVRARGAVGEGILALELPQNTWTREKDQALELGRMAARLALDPMLVGKLEALDYAKGASQVAVKGALGRLTEPRPDLGFTGALNLGDFAALAATPGLRGDVALTGKAAGRLDALAVSVVATGRGVGVPDVAVDVDDARLEYAGTRATADINVRAFAGRIKANGSLDTAGGRTDGRATVAGIAFEALPKSAALPPELHGRLSGDLTWNGDRNGRVAVTSHLRTEAQYQQPLTANAELSGSVFPKEERLDLRFTTTAETQGTGALRSGVVQAEGTARGPWPPTIEGAAKIVVSAAIGGAAATEPLEAETTFRAAAAETSLKAKGTFLGGTFEAGGRLAKDRIEDATLSAVAIELHRIDPRAAGSASLKVAAAGKAAAPDVDASFATAGLAVNGIMLDTASVTLKGPLSGASWTAAVPALNLTGSGRFANGQGGSLNGTLTAEQTDLALFAPLVPRVSGLAGTLSATADLNVPLGEGAAQRAVVSARVTQLEARTASLGPAQAEPFGIRYGGGQVAVTGFHGTAPGLVATLDGTYGLDAGRAVAGRARLQVDLSKVSERLQNAAGNVDASFEFSGNETRPVVTGAINLAGIAVDQPGKPTVRVADGVIRIAGNAAVVDNLKAETDGGAVVVTGRVPVPALVRSWRADPLRVQGSEAADLTVSWNGFDAGALLARMRPTSEERLTAQLTGSLKLSGGLASPDEVEALLASQPAEIAVGETTGRLEGFEVKATRGLVSTAGIEIGTAGASFRVAGSATLQDRRLDLTGKGKVDLRVLSPLLASAALSGTATVDAAVKGTAAAPDARGSVTISGATARLRMMTQSFTGIEANAVLEGNQVRVDKATAVLGGGNINASGTVALAGRGFGTVDMTITGKEIALRYPEGLRSRIQADLKLTGTPGQMLLSGDVRASRALYDRDFQTTSFLASVPVEDSPALRRIALNINVIARSPLRIRNDTARLEATGRLNIRGDLQSPSPFGRFEVVTPGGELYLLGGRYTVNRGTIVYNGTFDPLLDIEIQRRVRIRPSDTSQPTGDYTAIIAANGTVNDISREVFQMALGGGSAAAEPQTLRFTAEGPGDVDPVDVGYVALTGRRRNDIRGVGIAGEQTQNLLAGRLARSITKGLPFENVTIQPERVSRETDTPETRWTFGAGLAAGVDLTYAVSLANSEDRLIQLDGRPFRNFTATAKREYDIDRKETIATGGVGQRFEFARPPARQRLRADGTPQPRTRQRRQEKVEIAEVRVTGIDDAGLQQEARGVLKTKVGKSVDIWTVQDDGDRIRERFLDKGYLDVEVGADIEDTAAVFNVRPGRPYVARISGMNKPPALTAEMHKALYEEEALDKGRDRILADLFERGFFRAKVKTSAVDEGASRVLLFQVEPGPALKLGKVTFPGATAVSEKSLLAAAGGAGRLISDPGEARTDIRKEYAEHHYLEAQVEAPKVTESGGVIDIEVKVQEGQQATVAVVIFEGASRPESELLALSKLRAGVPYDEVEALASVDAIRNDYYRKGWAAARVYATHEDRAEGIVFTYHVTEGKRLTIGRIEIVGLNRVNESFVRSNIKLRAGEPLDPIKVGEMERRLLQLTVFSRVSSTHTDDDPATITVDVQERARYAASYELRYNTPEKLAPIVDGEVRNLFGRGLSVGARYRRSSVIDQWRGSLFIPSFLWRGDLYTSVFREKEVNFGSAGVDCNVEPTPDVCGVTQLERGFQLQESVQLGQRNTILFGYRMERAVITSPVLIEPSTQNTAALTLSGIRDTRDDVLDARHGKFTSLNLTLAPALLGSDQNFMKGLAQVFWSIPAGRKATWAQGYRLGLAHVFSADSLISTQGFTAGGGNTIRGLATDALQGTPDNPFIGAQGLLVINQELRVRTDSGFGAVVFYDTGQVFERVRKIDLDLRHSVGVGLRYSSPFGLLRVDVATLLNRRRNPLDGAFIDKKFQFWFSLGQAF